MKRRCLVALVMMALSAAPAQGQSTEELRVEIDPQTVETTLGESFDIEVTVTNQSDQPSASLVAHIDITDPAQATSVDPEDWTETLSQSLGVIPAGASESVTWTLQPISPGSFYLYAVALSGDNAEVRASPATTIEVEFVQTLNPEGVLPVVLAGPLLVGALLVSVMRRSRRRALLEAPPQD